MLINHSPLNRKRKKITGLAGVLDQFGEPISKSSCACEPGDALGGARCP